MHAYRTFANCITFTFCVANKLYTSNYVSETQGPQTVKAETNNPKEEVVIIDEEKTTTTQKAAQSKKSISRDDILKKLRELNELKEMGVIDEAEFNQMKKSLLENF